ncbi:DUF6262 family protein [Paenibacillus andongensis]|uniref:DUF6262 family protein n=1 Tax=Paenibacillus andongensis TaxID=2975482 RepID=UPI0021BB4CEB|nr:DUF6262 family protein [Paenibacillus andongensis]
MLNVGLQQVQQLKRDDSVEKVKWAVNFLHDTEGSSCRITALKISDISGLSRAALYKKHLRPLWDKTYKTDLLEVQRKHSADIQQRETRKLEEKIISLELQLKKSQHQVDQLIRELENEKARSKVYRLDFEKIKEHHQAVLHHNLRILRKLHVRGIDISEFEDVEVQVFVESKVLD